MLKKTFFFFVIISVFLTPLFCDNFLPFVFGENFHLKISGMGTEFPTKLKNYSFSENHEEENGTQPPQKKIKSKKLGRAVIFNLSLWLIDSIRYWATYTNWIEDWQFQLNWEDQKRRIFRFEGNKFDSNPFSTNWSHVLSGAIYYNFARYHRLSILESVLFETVSSFLWEYVTEWREVISVNDNIFSGLGGLPVGEPIYQISGYLLSRKGFGNQLLGSVLNPVMALSNLFGGKKWRRSFEGDYFSKPGFDIFFGQKDVRYNNESFFSSRQLHIGVESSFNKIPEFGEPGHKDIALNLKDTINGRAAFGITFSLDGIEEYTFNTNVIYLGHFRQNIRVSQKKGLYGYSFLAGIGSAFELFKKKAVAYYDINEYHYDFTGNETPTQPTEFTDKLAIINVAGPVLNLTLYSGNLKFGLSLESYLDFALVNSLALNKFSKSNDLFEERRKTTLTYYGYYYAFGYTIAGGTSLALHNFILNGNLKYQKYDSIDGLDRFQDKIEDDSNVEDSRFIYKLSFGYTFPESQVQLIVSFENIKREGSFKNVFNRETESRLYSQIKISF